MVVRSHSPERARRSLSRQLSWLLSQGIVSRRVYEFLTMPSRGSLPVDVGISPSWRDESA